MTISATPKARKKILYFLGEYLRGSNTTFLRIMVLNTSGLMIYIIPNIMKIMPITGSVIKTD